MAATLYMRVCLRRRRALTHGSPRRLWWWLEFGEYHHKRPSKLDLLVLDTGMDKQVALFNKTHPDIHITLNNVGSGPIEYNKLFTAIKAANEPDLSQIEFQTSAATSRRLVRSLNWLPVRS